MYEAFRKKTPDAPIENVRICFECGEELLRYKEKIQNEENSYKNRNAWMPCKVLISKFNCCSCGTSCDANFKVTDGFIGKIPFFRFAFLKQHQFCVLCYQNVKNGVPNAGARNILDPNQCTRSHRLDNTEYQIELVEAGFTR